MVIKNNKISNGVEKILIKFIIIYQLAFSPDHSFWAHERYPYGFCRFYPSCSEYAKRSLQNFGILKALKRIIWRVLRCNPFSAGGIDF